MTNKCLATVIKQKIDEKGMTLTYVSKQTGIKVNTISSSLLGKRAIRGEELVDLAQLLGLEVNDFSPPPNNPNEQVN